MKKLNFVFYYFVILTVSIFISFSFVNWSTINANYNSLFVTNTLKQKSKAKNAILTREVAIAISDRIGNISYFNTEIEYSSDDDNLARKSLEKLFEYTKTGAGDKKKVKGVISPNAEFLGYSFDNISKCAYITVSPEYIENMTTRKRTIAKKQIILTLCDVYKDDVDCKFIIDEREYDF